jgi:hypothetical protein
MATIKLQPSGAVVLKDGKVACACCAQPGCCPYPARAFVNGLYSVADLPDEILLNNVILDLFDKVFAKTGGSISFYEATQNGELMSVRINTYIDMQGIERSVWILLAYGEEYGLSSNPSCLISGEDEANPSKDTFANSYTATDPSGDSITLTRESLCVWIGPEPDFYQLQYFDDSASEPVRCKWFFIDSLKDEGQFQNTPTGNYTQPVDVNPWIIS